MTFEDVVAKYPAGLKVALSLDMDEYPPDTPEVFSGDVGTVVGHVSISSHSTVLVDWGKPVKVNSKGGWSPDMLRIVSVVSQPAGDRCSCPVRRASSTTACRATRRPCA